MTPALPARIIVHPGFHKTGTTTAQTFLRENRKVIRRHADFVLKWRFEPVTRAARAFSNSRSDLDRARFRFRFIGFLGTLEPMAKKPLLISSEELLGHMPGHKAITDYSAAPDLCEDMADALRHHFGAAVPLTFLFTTRGARAWLQSAWAHTVTRSKETRDRAGFDADLAGAANFDTVLSAVRRRVGSAEVVARALEDVADDPLGPGAYFTRALDLPDRAIAKLRAVDPQNVALDVQALDASLAHNRRQTR